MPAKKTTKKEEETKKVTKKTTKKEEKKPVEEKTPAVEEVKEEKKTSTTGPKFKLGDIVFLSKDIDADLEGFKLFPQYKKYAYTIEQYFGDTRVYVLRHSNFVLKIKEEDLLAPSERHNNPLIQMQY